MDWPDRVCLATIGLIGWPSCCIKDKACMPMKPRYSNSDPGKGKTKPAYLWAYRSNDLDGGPPIAVFDYQTSRRGQHAAAFRMWLARHAHGG